MDDSPEILVKCCTKCNIEYPATSEYFHKTARGKYGLEARCKKCSSEQKKDYYKANSDRINKRTNAYARIHREQVNVRQKRYRAQNTEQTLLYSRKYEAKPETQEKRVRYRQEHKEALSITARRYRRAHLLEYRVHASNRRSRKKALPGSYTPQDIEHMYKAQKSKCYWCRKTLITYHVDHVIPVTREGSSNDPGNLVLSCPTCNKSRSDRLPHEWPQGGRLL